MACAQIPQKCYEHQTLKFTCRDCFCDVVLCADGFLTIFRDNTYLLQTDRFKSDCKSCSKIVRERMCGGTSLGQEYWMTLQPDANVVSMIVSERTIQSYIKGADTIRTYPVRRIILKSKNVKNCNQSA